MLPLGRRSSSQRIDAGLGVALMVGVQYHTSQTSWPVSSNLPDAPCVISEVETGRADETEYHIEACKHVSVFALRERTAPDDPGGASQPP